MTPTPFDPGAEFDRQVRTLLDKGYPAMSGLTQDAFARLVAPLRQTAVRRGGSMEAPTPARVPFVLVITKDLLPAERSMPVTVLKGKKKSGFIDRHYAPGELTRFDAIEQLRIPEGQAYLVFDVDRGEEFLNISPDDALPTIIGRGRTPITVDEGIALITHSPEALEKNRCFMTVGSRCGDRRVPALWISEGAPKLGWCWAGNVHTWLGIASAGDRTGLA